MTDEALQRWWPDLGAVVVELRRSGQASVADKLVDAVRGGATSGEIVGCVGVLLRDHRDLRAGLSEEARRAWDRVLADVFRAFPGERPAHWLARLLGPLRRRRRT